MPCASGRSLPQLMVLVCRRMYAFQLSDPAVEETIEVYVSEELVDADSSNGWTYVLRGPADALLQWRRPLELGPPAAIREPSMTSSSFTRPTMVPARSNSPSP